MSKRLQIAFIKMQKVFTYRRLMDWLAVSAWEEYKADIFAKAYKANPWLKEKNGTIRDVTFDSNCPESNAQTGIVSMSYYVDFKNEKLNKRVGIKITCKYELQVSESFMAVHSHFVSAIPVDMNNVALTEKQLKELK